MASTKLSPAKRRLLIKLERMLGRECYNANIQNWGPGGVFQGEGRDFRYPLTVTSPEGVNYKIKDVPEVLPDGVLISGSYKFGANELLVMRALLRMIEMLETEHGLDIARLKSSSRSKK